MTEKREEKQAEEALLLILLLLGLLVLSLSSEVPSETEVKQAA